MDIYNRNFDKLAEGYLSRLFPEDQEHVRRFITELQAQGYSEKRIEKYLSALVSIKKRLSVPFIKATKKDVERYAAWLERSDYSPWTKHDRKTILRFYLRWLGKEDTVNWMKIKPPKNDKLPEEVLTEEEIKRMAEAAYTTRDKAFVLGLYESGCRIGEFLPLKLKHVSFDKYGAVLRVSGKTGDRRIRLVFSALPLQRWLEEHPAKNDPEAFLWCKIPAYSNNPKKKAPKRPLNYGTISKLLKELAQKAGVKKKVNPHAFRHARATFMARHLKEPEMREFFGWGKDSEMPAIYVHLSGRDVDNSVLAVYGIKQAENSQEPVLKVEPCPRCQEGNDPASKFCHRCGLPLGEGFLVEEDSLEKRIEKLEEQMKVLAEVKSLLADIKNIKVLAESFRGGM